MNSLVFKPYIYLSLGINMVTLVISLLAQKFLPPQIPLFYGLAEGEGQITPSLALVIPSLASALVVILNSFLSLVLKDDFLKKMLILAGLATSFLATVTTIKIILLVGSL